MASIQIVMKSATGFLVGFLAAAVIATAIIWKTGFWSDRPRIDTSRPAVVRQVQQLQRLETVVFRIDKIVSGGYQSQYLPRFFAGDRLLLVVDGDVTAGVNLGSVDVTNVAVNGRNVRLRIPDAEVFAARIDNDRTRVYSRETGLFSRVDPNLESEVRREAERQVRQAALDGGILQTAAANARTTLTSFLRGLGFDQVEVR